MGELDGQVALVTGGAAGIGRAVVERYVAEGARVGVLDVAADGLRTLEAKLGESVVCVEADAATVEGNREAVERTVEAFGRLDVLVGNAAIFDSNLGLRELPLESLERAFDELFHVNVLGCLAGVAAALPELDRTAGSVILTASFASFATSGGGILYTASKHAVAGIVRELAYELAPRIRVNGVAPGVAPTTMRPIPALGREPRSAVLPGTREHLPLQEVPEPSDYAPLYVLLASRAASRAITGSILTADSGLAIRGIARPAGGLER